MENLKKQLEGEFNGRLEQLGAAELGTEEYKSAMDSMTKMADRIIEIEKIEIERDLKVQQAADDWAIKEQQIKIDKKDKTWKHIVDVGKVVLITTAGFGALFIEMKFEEDGKIFSTQGGRKVMDGLLRIFRG